MQSEITGPLDLRGVTAAGDSIDLSKKPRPGEAIVRVFLMACGAISVATTLGIILVLVLDAIKFFMRPEPTLLEFFTGTAWQPAISNSASFRCSGRRFSPASSACCWRCRWDWASPST